MNEKIRRYLIRPACNILSILPDKAYIALEYAARIHKPINFKNPQTFNEKMQWLKLNDRKAIYSQMADKYEVKNYLKGKIPEEYIIPTLGIWNSYDEIEFDKLPRQFVLKCTHDSGGVYIVKDKEKINHKEARFFFEGRLKFNYFLHSREWPYKNIKPRIMAEKYMEDQASDKTLNVYKILNFNGVPRIIQTIRNDKTDSETINYYDTKWQQLKLRQNHPNDEAGMEEPVNFNEMLEISKNLCHNFPFLRVDLYEINKKIYFSEFTFYSDGGFARFYPSTWDETLGSWINLEYGK